MPLPGLAECFFLLMQPSGGLAPFGLFVLIANDVHQCVGVAERPEKAPVEPSQRSKGELGESPDALGAPHTRAGRMLFLLMQPSGGSTPFGLFVLTLDITCDLAIAP